MKFSNFAVLFAIITCAASAVVDENRTFPFQRRPLDTKDSVAAITYESESDTNDGYDDDINVSTPITMDNSVKIPMYKSFLKNLESGFQKIRNWSTGKKKEEKETENASYDVSDFGEFTS